MRIEETAGLDSGEGGGKGGLCVMSRRKRNGPAGSMIHIHTHLLAGGRF